jgi:hypothetical protein
MIKKTVKQTPRFIMAYSAHRVEVVVAVVVVVVVVVTAGILV